MEDFFKTNIDYMEKGIEEAFKQFTKNLNANVSNSFSNFNNEYDKKVKHKSYIRFKKIENHMKKQSKI